MTLAAYRYRYQDSRFIGRRKWLLLWIIMLLEFSQTKCIHICRKYQLDSFTVDSSFECTYCRRSIDHIAHTFLPTTHRIIYSRFYASTKSYSSCDLRVCSRTKKRYDWLDFRHSIRIKFVLSFGCHKILGHLWFAVVECDFYSATLQWIRALK